jgi:hypothetical protein
MTPQNTQAGQSAGIRAWLVLTGKGIETEFALQRQTIEAVNSQDVLIFKNLIDACEYIVHLKVRG